MQKALIEHSKKTQEDGSNTKNVKFIWKERKKKK